MENLIVCHSVFVKIGKSLKDWLIFTKDKFVKQDEIRLL